ncbi:glycosyltransferase family 2 protein [Candidatus Gottesmanbacteria bacterium]|nr:glycosyltransferase family 2 protein [Candidatus Gottesmanbacteria bacterium]
MKTVSILIPIYNEEKTISQTIDLVVKTQVPGYKKQIIVINDGSTDGTLKNLNGWKDFVDIITYEKNQGKGHAIIEGLKNATGDIVLIQDADLEYSPKDYGTLLAPFEDPRVSVVYGSRFLGAHLSTMFVYALGNKFVTFITNILFNTNITDMETGYKAFRRDALKNITLRSQRFEIEPEITVKLLKAGNQIYEVPISYFGRKFSEGKKLTWRDGVSALGVLIWYRFFD